MIYISHTVTEIIIAERWIDLSLHLLQTTPNIRVYRVFDQIHEMQWHVVMYREQMRALFVV